ncbi:MAG: hypothetical protein PHS04_11570 [Tissierellia bacterium]|nr:hypothetical protein [Dysgonamonadaceae bacterium]MDD4438658.1 hypothetical protein [Tissierellia bacterium]NCB24213.1 hypothetical protein [Bacteroidia bacterium]
MKEWFEELPEYCPPKEAIVPQGMTVYRCSSSEVPDNKDFISQRLLNPDRVFNGVSECVARSLSVYDDLEACKNIFKLPSHRKRFKSIFVVNLSDTDGLIMKTFKDPNHYSWWRSNSFNFETANKVQ